MTPSVNVKQPSQTKSKDEDINDSDNFVPEICLPAIDGIVQLNASEHSQTECRKPPPVKGREWPWIKMVENALEQSLNEQMDRVAQQELRTEPQQFIQNQSHAVLRTLSLTPAFNNLQILCVGYAKQPRLPVALDDSPFSVLRGAIG